MSRLDVRWFALSSVLVLGAARGAQAQVPDGGAPDSGAPTPVAAPAEQVPAPAPVPIAPPPPPPAAAPPPVEAAPAPTGTAEALLPVVEVTAQRRTERVQDVPSAVTAVSGAKLREAGPLTAPDVTRYAPNANAWTTESRGRPRYFIRGLGVNDVNNNVVSPIAIYQDEVFYNSLVLQGSPLFDLDRVEVLRGPQGTLWGKNTTGGAIHFISRKPTFETGGYAKVGIGSYQQRTLEIVGNGTVIKDLLAVRASTYYESSEGWATNVFNNRKVGGGSDVAGRLQFLAKPTDNFTALLNLHVRKLDAEQRPWYVTSSRPEGTDGFGFTPIPYDRSKVSYNVDSVNRVNTTGGALNLSWRLAPVTITSVTGLEAGSRILSGDGDYSPREYSRSYSRTNVQQFSEELRVASPKDQRLSWLAGAFFLRDQVNSYSASSVLPSIPALPAPLPMQTPVGSSFQAISYEQVTSSAALFANAVLKVIDRFKINGGARWTYEKIEIDLTGGRAAPPVVFNDASRWWEPSAVNTPLTAFAAVGSPSVSGRRSWTNLSYELTPEFKITPEQLVYFKFASGFRSGNFQPSVSQTTPFSTIEPERIKSYELGYKSQWFGRKLTLNATGFYYDYDDIQVVVTRAIPAVGIVAVLQNAASGTVYGGELEAAASPIANLRLIGNLGLLHTRYDGFIGETPGGGTVDNSGNKFARAPAVTTFLSADYRFDVGYGSLLLGTDWRYTSKIFFNATTQNNPELEQQGYWTGNAYATYSLPSEPLSLTIYASNVTDALYRVHALPATNGLNRNALGAPRVIGATLTARF